MLSLIFKRAAVAPLVLVLLGTAAHAQSVPDPQEGYKILAARRMEMSKRAVDETLRRRFEEGKPTQSFPSDAAKKEAGKPGVLRAVSPEERRALEHNEKGLALFSKGKFEQAARAYSEAIRAYPALAAAHNNLGSAYFALGRYEDAASSFKEAVGRDARYGQAHFNLALAHLKAGREREANDALLAAARAFYESGAEHLQAGRLKEAEEDFRGLLRIDPDYPPAFLQLALVCNAARRYDEAAAHARRLTQLQPRNPDALEVLAESLHGLRRYGEAADAAESAVKLRPNSPAAHYFAGLSHLALGRREQALAAHARLKELGADAFAELLLEAVERK
ncbi:MAG TPA: tetratricopeptide repeat protein [Pyrinomonadaceae bacterium]|jgi:tetratricopeptide (TPR) repeat protein|nr:tetratricopeptide repeat protein [Pyrinomonadaceae bacterium]